MSVKRANVGHGQKIHNHERYQKIKAQMEDWRQMIDFYETASTDICSDFVKAEVKTNDRLRIAEIQMELDAL